MDDIARANREARRAWDENADFWDERMGEGNDFVQLLTWPATEQLLEVQPAERILDIACGNGLTSRRLAALGAEVVAIDFSESMIAHARRRTPEEVGHITYAVLDATDEMALRGLGERGFDAALCAMALFDMAEIEPLMRALSQLLKPGGRFVFSVTHPCFNNSSAVHIGELEDRAGTVVTRFAVKTYTYMTPSVRPGVGIVGQPRPHLYFDRPLHLLLRPAFAAGFVLDALEERAFPAHWEPRGNPLSWSGRFSEIPPVLVARMRLVR